jgi:hypothetical protein
LTGSKLIEAAAVMVSMSQCDTPGVSTPAPVAPQSMDPDSLSPTLVEPEVKVAASPPQPASPNSAQPMQVSPNTHASDRLELSNPHEPEVSSSGEATQTLADKSAAPDSPPVAPLDESPPRDSTHDLLKEAKEEMNHVVSAMWEREIKALFDVPFQTKADAIAALNATAS